jgi:septum formation protein
LLKIILASGSPRRIELLKQVGLEFDIRPADIDEDSKGFDEAGKYAMEMSRQKALFVAGNIHSPDLKDTFVLGADTVVGIDDHLLGKPTDTEDAIRMLKLLENRWHEVTTGITLVKADTLETVTEMEVTHVKVSPFPQGFLERYVASKEPFDKAGAYAIQGLGSLMVERIEGCFFNVMGLPLFRLSRMLEREGCQVLSWVKDFTILKH